MARDHARIICAIWRDPEFTMLSKDAQRLYMLLLSQPKLSLCGGLDYTPGRWAQMAGDDHVAAVEDAVTELEEGRFVLVDGDAAELVIRSFVKNDGISDSANLIQAMWKAWAGIYSDDLRQALVWELPDVAFQRGFGDEKKDYEPPREALEMRAVEPLPNPSPKGSPRGSVKGSPNPSPTPVPSPSPVPTPVVVPPDATAVARALAAHDLERLREDKPEHHVGDVDRWLESATRRRLNVDGDRISEALAAFDTVERAVAALTSTAPKPTPLDSTGRAQAERIERDLRRQAGEYVCAACEDIGVVEQDDGSFIDCDCKYRRSA